MGAVETLQQHLRDHAVNLTRRAADLAVIRTQAAASRRTGAMADAINHDEPVVTDSRVSCQIISPASYSEAQDVGTGIFGPSGQRITPTHAKALRFDWPAAGGVVFARSVAGAPGRHFFHDALPLRWRECLADSAGPP